MKKIFKIMLCLVFCTFICVCAVACAPSSIKKAENKMWEEGYTVTVNYDDVEGIIGEKGYIKAVESDNDGNEILEAYLFDKTSDAKAFYEKAETFFNKQANMRIFREGKWVICATSDAYEDFMD